MTRKIYKIEGIVVDKRDRGEKDIIFTVLTSEEGKIDILAKYAKKVPSRHNSGLELFNGVQCQLYQGRMLPLVTQSKQIFSFPNLIESYENIHAGFVILQYLKSFTAPHQHIHQLYALICKSLQEINDMAVKNLNVLTLAFELKFLRMLGIFHTTSVCEYCHKPFKNIIYLHQGHYSCAACTLEKKIGFSCSTRNSLIFMNDYALEDILKKHFPKSHIIAIEKILSHFLALSFPDQRTVQRYSPPSFP